MTLTPYQLSEYRDCKDHAVEIQKHNQIRFNSGSESTIHVIAKALVGHIGRIHDYRVASEVTVPNGEVDVILWGHPDRLSYAVELETNPTTDIRQDKLQRYVKQTPLDELLLINLDELPENHAQATEYLAMELGLSPP